MPSRRYLVVPILNKSFKGLSTTAWYLDDSTYISGLSDEDFTAVFRDKTDRVTAITRADQKCIYQVVGASATKEQVLHLGESARFSLNVFREQQPIVTSIGLEFTKKLKSKLVAVHDIPSVHDPYSLDLLPFSLKSGMNKNKVSAQFKFVRQVLDQYPITIVGVQRFNSALLRPALPDRIIDLAISLETLIPGHGELRHRFSIYNAMIAEPHPHLRQVAYKLYKTLYDARSAVVHGNRLDNDNNVAWVRENWDKVTNYAARSLSYHLFFLKERNLTEWPRHLLGLSLGTEKAITV